MKKTTLTKNELEIMNLLWDTAKPLSRSEIIELSPNRSWKESSIHILLNKLLEKGAIAVAGFVKTGKNYGRVYSAAITQEEYTVMQITNSAYYKKSKAAASLSLVSALIRDDEIDDSVIEELQQMLDERKKELKK